MKNNIFFWLITALFLTTACSETDIDLGTTDDPIDDPQVQTDAISFSAKMNAPISKATDTAFESGDQISVTAYSSDGSIFANNVSYTYGSSSFSSNDPIKYSTLITQLEFRALYPSMDISSDKTASFTVKSDQSSGSNYTDSDLMFGYAALTDSEIPQLTFNHLLTKIVVNITSTDVDMAGATASLNSVAGIDYNLSTFIYSATGSTQTITMASNGVNSYKAIIVPQTIDSNAPFGVVTTTSGDYEFYVSATSTLEPGSSYTISATIKEGKITFDSPIITDWIESEFGDDSSSDSTVNSGDYKFAIGSTSVSPSTGETTLMFVTSNTLDEGSISIAASGVEFSSVPSEWSRSSDNKYIYTIQDNGGTQPTDMVQYYLDATSGKMSVKNQYVGTSYHTWGMWGDKFATTRNTTSTLSSDMVTVAGVSDGSVIDVSGDYYAAISSTSYCDPESAISTISYYLTNNYIGKYVSEYSNGETATVVGFATAGDYVYVSYATTDVTHYAIAKGIECGWDGSYTAYVAQGNGSYTNSIGSSNSFKATSGVPFPLTPNSTFIARYPVSGSFESEPTFITTNKMGQAFGRTTSNPLNTVVPNNDDEYVYIFSPGTTRRYSTDLTNENDVEIDQYLDTDDPSTILNTPLSVKTNNKGASVMRIKYGAAEFDSSFGEDGLLDFESLMDNYTFSRVWHITGSKFLLRVIHTQYLYNASHKTDVGDADFYILDTDAKKLTKVTGLPDADSAFIDQGSNAIGVPYIEDGKAYIPMTPNTQTYPCIYIIDSSSATATKGLEVQATDIRFISKICAQ